MKTLGVKFDNKEFYNDFEKKQNQTIKQIYYLNNLIIPIIQTSLTVLMYKEDSNEAEISLIMLIIEYILQIVFFIIQYFRPQLRYLLTVILLFYSIIMLIIPEIDDSL